MDTMHAAFQDHLQHPPVITNQHIYILMVVIAVSTILILRVWLIHNASKLDEFSLQRKYTKLKEKLLLLQENLKKEDKYYLCEEEHPTKKSQCLQDRIRMIRNYQNDIKKISEDIKNDGMNIAHLEEYAIDISSNQVKNDCIKMKRIQQDCQQFVQELLEKYTSLLDKLNTKFSLMHLNINNNNSSFFAWTFLGAIVVMILVYKCCCIHKKPSTNWIVVKEE